MGPGAQCICKTTAFLSFFVKFVGTPGAHDIMKRIMFFSVLGTQGAHDIMNKLSLIRWKRTRPKQSIAAPRVWQHRHTKF